MQGKRSGVARQISGALVLGLAATQPLNAQPIGILETVPGGEAVAVIDIRGEDTCYDASLAGARCLPADWLIAADGSPISFHALRWLLGTVGLTGAETLVVYDGADTPGDAAWAIAAMAYLAGQADVAVHKGVGQVTDAGGDSRSLTREVIYTAPMRTASMAVSSGAEGTLAARLADFAREGGIVVFTPET